MYSELITQTINKSKKKKLHQSADKKRIQELEEKLNEQYKINKELEKTLIELDSKCRDLQITITRKEELYRDSILKVIDAKNDKKNNDENCDQNNIEKENYNFDEIEKIHNEIMERLENKKYSTKALILEKEREIIGNYEDKISKLKLDIQLLKSSQSTGEMNNKLNRIRKLEEENIKIEKLCDSVRTENKEIIDKNLNLNQQISTLINDREFLLKQIISIKKENKNLNLLIKELNINIKGNKNKNKHQTEKNDNDKFKNYSPKIDPKSIKTKIDERYGIIIDKIKKDLKNEKTKNLKLETEKTNNLKLENELKYYILNEIKNVENEIKSKTTKRHKRPKSAKQELLQHIMNENKNDKKSIINNEIFKRLLTKEKILQILYAKLFSTTYKITNQFDDKALEKLNKNKNIFKKQIQRQQNQFMKGIVIDAFSV